MTLIEIEREGVRIETVITVAGIAPHDGRGVDLQKADTGGGRKTMTIMIVRIESDEGGIRKTRGTTPVGLGVATRKENLTRIVVGGEGTKSTSPQRKLQKL